MWRMHGIWKYQAIKWGEGPGCLFQTPAMTMHSKLETNKRKLYIKLHTMQMMHGMWCTVHASSYQVKRRSWLSVSDTGHDYAFQVKKKIIHKAAHNVNDAWNVMYCICIKLSSKEEVPGCLVHCEPREDDERGERQVKVQWQWYHWVQWSR